MIEKEYHNPLYVSMHNFSMQKTNRIHTYNVDEISQIYTPSDKYTQSLIRVHDFIKNHDTIILPVENVISNNDFLDTKLSFSYWGTQETTLDVFDRYTLIDGGAYIGDTLQAIGSYTQTQFDHAYCFEPDKENADKLREYVCSNGLDGRVTVFEAGLGEHDMTANISESG